LIARESWGRGIATAALSHLREISERPIFAHAAKTTSADPRPRKWAEVIREDSVSRRVAETIHEVVMRFRE
jgi:hypothetical protein